MWQKFLDSLMTQGGKTFVLLFMLVWLAFSVEFFRMMGHEIAPDMKQLITGAFSAILSALMLKLGEKQS